MQYNGIWTPDKEHAFLAPSSAHIWRFKDKEYINNRYISERARFIGTALHEQAEKDILYGLKRPRTKDTFNMYVNDAISYRMQPEVRLTYSNWCYGTADAFTFKDGYLRIFDLKTGKVPAHMEQVITYAALFCLQNDIHPNDIPMELRLYQSGEVIKYKPESEEVLHTMDDIIAKTNWLDDISERER